MDPGLLLLKNARILLTLELGVRAATHLPPAAHEEEVALPSPEKQIAPFHTFGWAPRRQKLLHPAKPASNRKLRWYLSVGMGAGSRQGRSEGDTATLSKQQVPLAANMRSCLIEGGKVPRGPEGFLRLGPILVVFVRTKIRSQPAPAFGARWDRILLRRCFKYEKLLRAPRQGNEG